MLLGAFGFMIGTGGMGLLLTVLGIIFTPQIAKLLGAEGKMLTESVIYGRFLLIGLMPFMLQNVFQSFLVTAEKPGFGFVITVLAGEDGIAAYGVIMYVNFIFVAVFLGYAIGTAPIVGYHYGAGNKDEMHNVYKKSIYFNIVAAEGAALILTVILLVSFRKKYGY